MQFTNSNEVNVFGKCKCGLQHEICRKYLKIVGNQYVFNTTYKCSKCGNNHNSIDNVTEDERIKYYSEEPEFEPDDNKANDNDSITSKNIKLRQNKSTIKSFTANEENIIATTLFSISNVIIVLGIITVIICFLVLDVGVPLKIIYSIVMFLLTFASSMMFKGFAEIIRLLDKISNQ